MMKTAMEIAEQWGHKPKTQPSKQRLLVSAMGKYVERLKAANKMLWGMNSALQAQNFALMRQYNDVESCVEWEDFLLSENCR